jgi:hypothetical protein
MTAVRVDPALFNTSADSAWATGGSSRCAERADGRGCGAGDPKVGVASARRALGRAVLHLNIADLVRSPLLIFPFLACTDRGVQAAVDMPTSPAAADDEPSVDELSESPAAAAATITRAPPPLPPKSRHSPPPSLLCRVVVADGAAADGDADAGGDAGFVPDAGFGSDAEEEAGTADLASSLDEPAETEVAGDASADGV